MDNSKTGMRVEGLAAEMLFASFGRDPVYKSGNSSDLESTLIKSQDKIQRMARGGELELAELNIQAAAARFPEAAASAILGAVEAPRLSRPSSQPNVTAFSRPGHKGMTPS